MGLFGFGKKKEEKAEAPFCCCNGNAEAYEASAGSCCCGGNTCGLTSVKVLGAGCKSCHEQYEYVKTAMKAMNIPIEAEYITDMEKVMAYGAMSMPAIVVNEKVVYMGKVLKASDVEKLFHKLGY